MSTSTSARVADVLEDVRAGFASGAEALDGVLQVRMNNVTRDGRWDFAKKRYVPLGDKPLDRFLLRKGDVLFNATNSPEMVGKTALVDDLGEPTVFSNHFLRLRTDPKRIDPGYLSRWLHREFERGVFEATCQRWVNQAAITRDQLLSMEIPLLPMDEQRRIAQVLDMAEALRAKRREAIARLDVLEESVFREAFGDPVANEYGLPTVRLGDLGTWRSGGTPPRSRANYFDGDIPWFSSGELGLASLSESREQLTEQALLETSAKRVPQGAIMIGMYDTAALKASIAVVNGSCNQAVAFSKLEESVVSATYAHRALCIGREYFRRQQRGVRQKNLNLDLVRDLRIALPTMGSQLEFVEQAAQVGRLRAVCETHLTHLNSLHASIQSRAFAGEL